MKFSLSQSLLLLAAPLFANGAPFQRNSLSTSSLSQRTDLFGVSKLSHIARGGSQESKEAEVETLYLPGLLDAELTSSSEVNCR